MKPISIYVHVPFCASKCVYCDFNSFSPTTVKVSIETYFEALIKEINLYREVLSGATIETLFFGGGTPSLVEPRHIESVLTALKAYSTFSETAEITIECNPESLTQEKLTAYKAMGINRLSIGLQTTHNHLLKEIGRVHSYERFLEAYHAAREVGFDNINIDLMFGLPKQSKEDFLKSIHDVLALKPQHIASYSLKVEEGTPLYVLQGEGVFETMDEALERELYHLLIDTLAQNGIDQYELSNFAIKGKESKHNCVYWKNKPYLGFGASAHSKYDDYRFSNFSDLELYCDYVAAGDKPIAENQFIDTEEDLFESIMLGLRLNEGLDTKAIEAHYHIDFKTRYHEAIETCLKHELVIFEADQLLLTLKGRDLSNQVFVAFL